MNLRHIKVSTTPVLIPLYDLIGNYTIDEIINLNLDENFKRNYASSALLKNKPLTELDEIMLNSNLSLENQNDISYNVDELMKVKFIQCGTWFTVCTSQMFPSTLYIFGNFFKKLIKITYFEYNRLEIKQIGASNFNICILTTDNSVYKVNLNNFVNLKSNCEAENLIDSTCNLEIEKIGCGYDYLIMLTKSNQAIYINNFDKINKTLLNSEIRTSVRDISTGPSHFFLISSLNELNLGDFLYEKILNNINKLNDDMLYPDLFIRDISNAFRIPCHSFYLELFLNLDKLKICKDNERTEISIQLTSEEILTLIELIYTTNLKIISTEESKKVIENPEILRHLYNQLNDIVSFLRNPEFKSSYPSSDVLINLIYCYIDQIQRNLETQSISEEFSKSLINIKLNDSCNFILNGLIQSKVRNNLSDLVREENQNDQDNIDNFINRRNSGRNYFEQFGKKGTQIDLTRPVSRDFYDVNSISIDLYIQKQNQLVDPRYQFYFKIYQIREKLNDLKSDFIKNIKNPKFLFKIIDTDNEVIEINKLMIGFKSFYFNNFIKINKNISNRDEIFDLASTGVSYSKDCLNLMKKFLNSEKFSINPAHVFEMLDLSSYFMMDNLSALIEIELEAIVSKNFK
jgi:hypothetical protein